MEKKSEVLGFFLVLLIFVLILMYAQTSRYGSLSGFIAYIPDETESVSINLLQPEDNFITNHSAIEFVCEYQGNIILKKAIFYLQDYNGEEIDRQEIDLPPRNQSEYSFDYLFVNSGIYKWNCDFVDIYKRTYTSDASYVLTYDGSPPVISLSAPADEELFDTIWEEQTLEFQFSIEDLFSSECNLLVNDTIEETFTAEPVSNHVISKSFPEGEYIWKVSCIDELGNQGASNEREFKVNVIEDSGESNSNSNTGTSSSSGSSGSSDMESSVSNNSGNNEEEKSDETENNLDKTGNENNLQSDEARKINPVENLRVFVGRVIAPILGDKLSPVTVLLFLSIFSIISALIVVRIHHKRQGLKDKVELEHKLR